jgi:hypothetical protein
LTADSPIFSGIDNSPPIDMILSEYKYAERGHRMTTSTITNLMIAGPVIANLVSRVHSK